MSDIQEDVSHFESLEEGKFDDGVSFVSDISRSRKISTTAGQPKRCPLHYFRHMRSESRGSDSESDERSWSHSSRYSEELTSSLTVDDNKNIHDVIESEMLFVENNRVSLRSSDRGVSPGPSAGDLDITAFSPLEQNKVLGDYSDSSM